MIQRIQSIYLLLAACAMALVFMFPIATYQGETTLGTNAFAELRIIPQSHPEMLSQLTEGSDIEVDQSGLISIWPLMALAGVVLAIALVDIFLFKNRMLQVRVAAVGFLLSVVYFFLVFFWAVDSYYGALCGLNLLKEPFDMSYSLATWSPVASVVFFLLAQRAIKRDEAKVRAADRLR